MPLNDVEMLRKYLNKVFVETGTYKGDGIQLALDVGFEKVHSMEIFEPLYMQSSERFANNYNVKIWKGDTSIHFGTMIKSITEPITFWLDSHVSGWDSGYNPKCPTPLMKELTEIANHPIKTHTILIDDVRLFDEWGMSVDNIKNLILAINPKYVFKFEDGYVSDDILVAYIF